MWRRRQIRKTFWDYQKEQEEQNVQADTSQKLDEKQIEAECQDLLNTISFSSVNTLREIAAWILNHYPDTRDSDITLQLKFWETFKSDIYNGRAIRPSDLYKLTHLTSLARERARIQNQFRLFLATKIYNKTRGTLSKEEKDKAIQDKPSHPLLEVYMADSGKTRGHLLIGSIWFLVAGYQIKLLSNETKSLREPYKFEHEFHFKEMKPNELPIYKELISIFLKQANAVCFKMKADVRHYLEVYKCGKMQKSEEWINCCWQI